MKTIIFPGSFDPFTLGHADIARRAAALCDSLIVAVMVNRAKKSLFTQEERVRMAELSLGNDPKIKVLACDRLLVELFSSCKASAIVRGLRSESDFRGEAEMVAANRLLLPEFEAIFLPCRIDLSYTSSTIIKEVASYGGDISGMVSPAILEYVTTRISRKANTDLTEGIRNA